MQPDPAWRLFISIPLPVELRLAVTEFQQAWKQRVPRGAVRWTPPGQMHLTLRFLGDVPDLAVPALNRAIQDACANCAPFALHLAGPGTFPDWRRPRVFWLGVGGDLDVLARLQDGIEKGTRSWGKVEDRGFHPHLTLGRVAENSPALRDVPEPLKAGITGAWPVGEIHLMRSVLSPQGAVHSSLSAVQLQANRHETEQAKNGTDLDRQGEQ
jgi:2'-5' RNA ligase